MKLQFSRQILEKSQLPNLMKIRPVGIELFHAGGRTDGHNEVNSRFSQFCERA
jgi:16S rRNA G1207 methylase RsmC